MATYLLVHGGWHGAWCWQRVVPLLRAAGHRVSAPDLPGHGDDPTPIAAVQPGSDVQRVCDVLDTLAEPAILVGHSSGGMVISAAAELRPGMVRGLVYLAAFLLPPDVTPPMVMRDDTEAILQSSLVVDELQRTLSVRDEALRDVFYADCSDEDAAWARARLVPEPLRSPATPPAATPESPRSPAASPTPEAMRAATTSQPAATPESPRSPAASPTPEAMRAATTSQPAAMPESPRPPATLAAASTPEPPRAPMSSPAPTEPPAPISISPPRFYVETLRDRALGPATQRKMYLALPCRIVYSLPTSHSPFLSAPRALADCLLDVDRSLAENVAG